ncbi:MAG: hypothetical protein ACPG51_03660 [Thiolinea sp.]
MFGRPTGMKHQDTTYHCSFLPPLLLAIALIALSQIAEAGKTIPGNEIRHAYTDLEP